MPLPWGDTATMWTWCLVEDNLDNAAAAVLKLRLFSCTDHTHALECSAVRCQRLSVNLDLYQASLIRFVQVLSEVFDFNVSQS